MFFTLLYLFQLTHVQHQKLRPSLTLNSGKVPVLC